MDPTVPLFVGLDYSQHAVQICVLDPAGKVLGNRAVPDDADAIAQVAQRFGTVRGAALEACTGAADLAEELADRFAWPVHLAHPGFVSRMKQSPDKTDFSDARVLADLERVGYLPRIWIAPKALRELRTLVRDRQQLAAQRRNLKLQMAPCYASIACAVRTTAGPKPGAPGSKAKRLCPNKPAGSWSNAYAASPGSNRKSTPSSNASPSSPAPTPPSTGCEPSRASAR